ncbi:hypothetical protein EVAR_65237_1 [Eumeta japonica]|uniref:Uncharacterized protein n=1 Tax=Eumeta variegata TaxID=151549 RepID=A0A4C1ZFS0_EUMVA|nr:hypothetical protein EVAR_65237_1 [Eumeta japonica]
MPRDISALAASWEGIEYLMERDWKERLRHSTLAHCEPGAANILSPRLVVLSESLNEASSIQYNARNSVAVKLVTKASRWRKVATHGRRRKGVEPAHYIFRRQFRAAEFRALYCTYLSILL